MSEGFAATGTIEAVLFDFHSTLVDQGDPYQWLDLAWAHAGRAGSPAQALGEHGRQQLAGWVNRIWEHVREVDPHNERDLSPRRHREVYDTLMQGVPQVDDELARSLYEVMLETWIPYDDAVPTLTALKSASTFDPSSNAVVSSTCSTSWCSPTKPASSSPAPRSSSRRWTRWASRRPTL